LGDFWGDFLLSLGDFLTKTSGHPVALYRRRHDIQQKGIWQNGTSTTTNTMRFHSAEFRRKSVNRTLKSKPRPSADCHSAECHSPVYLGTLSKLYLGTTTFSRKTFSITALMTFHSAQCRTPACCSTP
jgi:hypothetical protein